MADDSAPLSQQLREGEKHWAWKVGMRAAICALDIIGIGCTGWLMATLGLGYNDYYFDGAFYNIWSLIPMGISFIWSAIAILVQLLRKKKRAIHPGAIVGVDLILWLAFIVTGLLVIGAVLSIAYFGDDPSYLQDPYYGSSDYDGHYHLLKSNNTWVYKIDDVYSCGSGCTGHYNYHTGTYTNVSIVRDCEPYFSTCAKQDAFVNRLWHLKSRIVGSECLLAAVQWLNVLLHFILFVWACVDTHRRKNRQSEGKEQAVAERVIRDLQARGLITAHGPAEQSGSARPEAEAQLSGALPGNPEMEEISPAR